LPQVVVPKAKGEILGVVIVESGWGSMLPTIVLANLAPGGPAARCGQLNIGDQVPILPNMIFPNFTPIYNIFLQICVKILTNL
jgi:hypothetical protein